MAFAKNISLNSVFGITPFEHSSSSSSLLWSLLLVMSFSAFGINDFIPLILNMILSFLILGMLFYIFKKFQMSGFSILISLLTVIIITPLTLNVFTGMEHILHALFAIPFIFLSVHFLINQKKNMSASNKICFYLYALSALTASVRYESLLLIIIISVLHLFQKKYYTAFFIVISGIIPLTIFGLISLKTGGSFLPNSVLLKAFTQDSSTFISGLSAKNDLLVYLQMNRKILFLLVLSVFMFLLQVKLQGNFMSEIPLLLLIVIVLISVQKIFFSLSFFRYDTYLVITAVSVNAVAVNNYITEGFGLNLKNSLNFYKNLFIAGSVIYSAFLVYKVSENTKIPAASRNIYEQQYQMSEFIKKYYPADEIALNDIGVVNYYNDIYCTDLIGIGNNGITSERLSSVLDKNRIGEITESGKVKIAILYDSWFVKSGGLPDNWYKAGEWTIQDNFICGDDKVTFYAVETNEKERLITNLKLYSEELPFSVIQTGAYREE